MNRLHLTTIQYQTQMPDRLKSIVKQSSTASFLHRKDNRDNNAILLHSSPTFPFHQSGKKFEDDVNYPQQIVCTYRVSPGRQGEGENVKCVILFLPRQATRKKMVRAVDHASLLLLLRLYFIIIAAYPVLLSLLFLVMCTYFVTVEAHKTTFSGVAYFFSLYPMARFTKQLLWRILSRLPQVYLFFLVYNVLVHFLSVFMPTMGLLVEFVEESRVHRRQGKVKVEKEWEYNL